MNNLYTAEEKAAAVTARIKEYNKAASILPELVKVLKAFDGKVYNCRLEKALQEALKIRVYVKKTDYNIDIHYYGEDNQWITLACAKLADALKDGKRINSAAFIEDAEKRRNEFLKRACRIEVQAPQVEEIKKRVKQLEKILDALTGSLDYDLRDIYGIHYQIRNY